MKALILGAGFGTRLERDLKNDTTGKYGHLLGVPKPLLPIGKYPLITHWMHMLQALPQIDQVYIVTNGVNHAAFEKWKEDWPDVKLVCDDAMSNETRTGAVGCMNLSVEQFDVKDHLLIIAGDTLFYDDFSLADLLTRYDDFLVRDNHASMLVYVTCTDQEVHKYGILETDSEQRVIGFLEKPQPHETPSRKECPCFYLFNKNSLHFMKDFLDDKKDAPMKARDATGNFVAYLHPKSAVYATEISGRYDVGGLESYIVCHEQFIDKS